jgi:2'-5' RNA ligase
MRMFIASPVKITPEIESIVNGLSSNENLKITGLNNFHLTYLFLGEISLKESNSIIKKLERISTNTFQAKISSITAFPDFHHPRVIVLVLESPFFYDLYNSILKVLPEYRNSRREFMPHITIARVKNRNTAPDVSRLVISEGMLLIDQLCLFKSTLTPEGPLYERIYCSEF